MARLHLVRNSNGDLIATANGDPISGAYVKSIERFNDMGVSAVIIIPLKDALIKEIDNVIPLRAER